MCKVVAQCESVSNFMRLNCGWKVCEVNVDASQGVISWVSRFDANEDTTSPFSSNFPLLY